MVGTVLLDIEQVSSNQNQKEVTINDGLIALEQSNNQTIEHDLTAGNVIVTQSQFVRNIFHTCTGHLANVRTLTVPQQITPNGGIAANANRLFIVNNQDTGTVTVDQSGGGTTVDVDAGLSLLIYHTGTNLVSIGSVGGGGGGGGDVDALDWKSSVRAATTVAGTLATSFENGDTIDGVVLATGNRILIKDQATGSENGIYTVNATGAPTRATDADIDAEVTAGLSTVVEEGTDNSDTIFILTTNGTIILDTTGLTFAALSVGGGGGASTFTGLTDTPADFSGQDGKVVSVNLAGTALEFSSTASLSNTSYIYSLYEDSPTLSSSLFHAKGSELITDKEIKLIGLTSRMDTVVGRTYIAYVTTVSGLTIGTILAQSDEFTETVTQTDEILNLYFNDEVTLSANTSYMIVIARTDATVTTSSGMYTGTTVNSVLPSLPVKAARRLMRLDTAVVNGAVINTISGSLFAIGIIARDPEVVIPSAWKEPVRAATTVAGTLATSFENADTIDGVVLATGDRILIKDQATGSENGIYTVNATGAPTRALDSDTNVEVNSGMSTIVTEGTSNNNRLFSLTTNNIIVLDTTTLVFDQIGKIEIDISDRLVGQPIVNEIISQYLVTRNFTIPVSMAGSVGKIGIAATSQTDFDVRKNNVSFGTMRFAAAATTATFIAGSATSFSSGDEISIVAPTPDATLSDMIFTLVGIG